MDCFVRVTIATRLVYLPLTVTPTAMLTACARAKLHAPSPTLKHLKIFETPSR